MIIGLTGGIGAGKSLISKILESLSFPVFNSDLEAKLLVENNLEIKSKIKELLGDKAYTHKGYNRPYVANIVFQNVEKLELLNSIIHPAVRRSFQEFAQKSDSKLIFNEAAILFETGAFKTFDKTILVCANEELRIKRIVKRDNTSVEEVKSRLAKQWPDAKKRPLADFIIENNETESVLLQLNEIIDLLK